MAQQGQPGFEARPEAEPTWEHRALFPRPTLPMDRRVVYLRCDDAAELDMAQHVPQHAMKPWRLSLTHALVDLLGLRRYMTVVDAPPLPIPLLREFHTAAYVEGLEALNVATWENLPLPTDPAPAVGYSSDCPLIDGVVQFGSHIAGASVAGAALLNAKEADVAVNWAGGMHHARAGDCSGFCYINDIVLGILELLKCHHRVLYIDLDVHHGDGVEEAFYLTDRVFTLSLHKFGESFFPGTGHASDIGLGAGRFTSLNLTLADATADPEYVALFAEALAGVAEHFKPNAVVLQCGADSLAGDRIGPFNLSSIGHGMCVSHVRELGLPLLVLGGGGYTIKNVSKLWAYETSILCGNPLPPSTKLDFGQGPEQKADCVYGDDAADAPLTTEAPAAVGDDAPKKEKEEPVKKEEPEVKVEVKPEPRDDDRRPVTRRLRRRGDAESSDSDASAPARDRPRRGARDAAATKRGREAESEDDDDEAQGAPKPRGGRRPKGRGNVSDRDLDASPQPGDGKGSVAALLAEARATVATLFTPEETLHVPAEEFSAAPRHNQAAVVQGVSCFLREFVQRIPPPPDPAAA